MPDTTGAACFVAGWASDQDRAETTQRPQVAASLLARATLRAVLNVETGRGDWRIVRSPLGKPSVVTPSGLAGPAVSISHTRGMIAVAVAQDGALGVDIEHARPRDVMALATGAFGAAEQAEVARGGAEAFYRIWTLREAIAKATGEGLALAANREDLVERVAGSPCYRSHYDGRSWYLWHMRLGQGHSLAVAHADPTEDPWSVRWIELPCSIARP
jgi:4'-phosphopantetheinyl transferase